MNGPVARMIIPTIANVEKTKENLNLFRTLGTSIKKLENSTSLDVAPHVYSFQLAHVWVFFCPIFAQFEVHTMSISNI